MSNIVVDGAVIQETATPFYPKLELPPEFAVFSTQSVTTLRRHLSDSVSSLPSRGSRLLQSMLPDIAPPRVLII